MSDIIKKVSEATDKANGLWDKAYLQVAEKLGIQEPLRIMPYRGYGRSNWVYVKGRVLEKEGIKTLPEDAPVYENVLNMYRRFDSDEVPNAKVKIRVKDEQVTVEADDEGFFETKIELSSPLKTDELWCSAYFELVDPAPTKMPVVNAEGEFLVVPPSARFGVISDIDDTVVYTAAQEPLKMVEIAYLGNAHSRRPFAGVDPFYQFLQSGVGGDEGNPVFYVSSSPWNMYDLFDKFMDINDIPNGPILLRDIELSPSNLMSFSHEGHKKEQIEPILNRFPDLPFILFGDSGQKDPEIYLQIVQDYPERILAVCIRDVSDKDKQRHDELDAIALKLREANVDFVLFPNTITVAKYAASRGWIEEEKLIDIASDTGVC